MNVELMPYNTFPSIGNAISASQSGRMSMPVSDSSYIYSQFEHVSGVPAPDGVQGVSINRLKIMDSLIERLSQIKNEPVPSFEIDMLESEERADTVIETIQNEIRMLHEARANSPYPLAPQQTGVLFDIFV